MYIIEESNLIEIRRLMEWIAENAEDWQKICSVRVKPLKTNEYKRLLGKLRQERFYIIVLFMMFQDVPKLTEMAERALLKML